MDSHAQLSRLALHAQNCMLDLLSKWCHMQEASRKLNQATLKQGILLSVSLIYGKFG